MSLQSSLRFEAVSAPESGIVAVMSRGRMVADVLPLWAGEGDLPTPEFIRAAAVNAINAGETFYTWQRGIPELRVALSQYHNRHFVPWLTDQHFFVTGSGMQSIQIAIQMIAGSGDEIVYLSPAWPNFAAAAGIAGATAIPVALDFGKSGWQLDIEKLKNSVSRKTKALFINSPSNPTGWTAKKDELAELLDFARQHGLWIIADEIYALFHYQGTRAASFFDVMEPEDRILFVNSFSKNWAMTGWRMGWIAAHPSLGPVIENLIQYSTSGVAQFMQRAGVAALDQGDEFIRMQVDRALKAREILCEKLGSTGKVQLVPPDGAFYLYFKIDGVNDSLGAAFSMVENARVGIAPGSAFAADGAGWFRICFNRNLKEIETGAMRLTNWIDRFA